MHLVHGPRRSAVGVFDRGIEFFERFGWKGSSSSGGGLFHAGPPNPTWLKLFGRTTV